MQKGERKVCKISKRPNLVQLAVNTFKHIGAVVGIDGIIVFLNHIFFQVQLSGVWVFDLEIAYLCGEDTSKRE